MKRLVLWDIDRTLVTIDGVSREIYAAALTAVTGRELQQMPDLAGKTDRELVASVLELHSLTAQENVIEDFYLGLAFAAGERVDQMRAKGQALPGAQAAVAALGQMSGVVQSVVTGNIAPIAKQKLSLFGLDDQIDFEVGGYGSDSSDRSILVRLACERAEHKYSRTFPREHVVVVGDTPYDVVGARENGVVAVAVATGSSSSAELTEAGAHIVLSSLVDTKAVLAAVTGAAIQSGPNAA